MSSSLVLVIVVFVCDYTPRYKIWLAVL